MSDDPTVVGVSIYSVCLFVKNAKKLFQHFFLGMLISVFRFS